MTALTRSPVKHKTIVKIAILMLVVFGATVLLYPTLYGPETRGTKPAEAPPIAAPAPIGK